MPRLLDLFCGRGGWTRAALKLGWSCVGIDVEDLGYPAQLVQIRLPVSVSSLLSYRPDLIVASPPCEEFARAWLPWLRGDHRPAQWALDLLTWSVGLVGCGVPVVVECSRFAGWHVPGGRYVRPYTLWGDLPVLLPYTFRTKDCRRGTSSLPRALRTAQAAEIPADLAEWIIDYHGRKGACLACG